MAKAEQRRDPTEPQEGDKLTPEQVTNELLNRSRPGRPRTTKRDRGWERRQRQVSYRGIPVELQERLKEIAQQHRVTVGEIARAFLEYGIDAYDAGNLQLEPRPVTEKRTLYPDD